MNRITLMGRLTAEPELKEGNGTKYCNFSIAVDRVKKNNTGAITDFFNCVTFGYNAEFVSRYMRKGQRILVSGAIHIDSYTSKSGEKRTAVNVVVDTVESADGKRNGNDEGKETDEYDGLPFNE